MQYFTEFTQREYDKKWLCWASMPDPELSDEEIYMMKKNGIQPVSRWVLVGVYDNMIELTKENV